MEHLKLLFKLAVRNVSRNVRRTVLTSFLIGVGIAALMVMDGVIVGMSESMIRTATETFMGHAQIHRNLFREDLDVALPVAEPDKVTQILKSSPSIAHFSPRTLTKGMLSSASEAAGVAIYGIDPPQEAQVSRLKEAVVEGSYLTGTPETEILLGQKLAEKLKVGLGDRVVLTVAGYPDSQGKSEMSQELFRVSGIFRYRVRSMDDGMVFIQLAKARKILKLPPGAYHEMAFRFKDLGDALRGDLPVWQALRKISENESYSWKELSPGLGAMLDMSQFSLWISGLILFGIVSLSVINSLFMSIYERIFEFGVMKAIGTRGPTVAQMIACEAAVMGAGGMAMGLLLGTGINFWLGSVGIDYGGAEFSGVTFLEPIYAVMGWNQYLVYPWVIWGLTVLVSLYPARFAAKLNPAEAMRKSL